MEIEQEDFESTNNTDKNFLENNYSNKEIINSFIKRKMKIPFDSEITKCTGKGGSSYIYNALINHSNNSIILKLITEERSKNDNIKEIKILSKLKNKYIIGIIGYNLGEKDEPTIIAMENGKYDLRQFFNQIIKRKVSTESLLCYITYQILEGLNYLYRCNIVHCDIKPQNIIINDHLEVKIIDFSIADDISNIKENEIKLKYKGTPLYIAPEVIKQQKINIKDYHKVDLFSLGIMLYRLAFGKYPFNIKYDDNDAIIYNKIMSNWKVENIDNEFSFYFIDFLNGLLNNNIEKRMNIKEAMNHHWIKGADILMKEKENVYNANIFLAQLITDFFPKFNEYNQKKT